MASRAACSAHGGGRDSVARRHQRRSASVGVSTPAPSSRASHAPRRHARQPVRPQALPDHLGGGEQLASEFASHVNQLAATSCLKQPLQHRRPSPLDPPTAAVAAQLDALQINDWPEQDAGVHTCLAYAKPFECEQLVAAPQALTYSSGPSRLTRVRSWAAREAWLTPEQFAEQLHAPPYSVLLGCDSWRPVSQMVFPSTRGGQRAVQAVEVLARPPGGSSSSGSSSGSNGSSNGRGAGLQKFTFTFLLELVAAGPLRGCWLCSGVRPGNYSV